MVELGAPWRTEDEDDARRRINDHWNGLMSLWELRKQELGRRLVGDGLLIEPRLEKLPGGGAGNKASYRLRFFPVAIPPAVDDSTYEDSGTDRVSVGAETPDGTGKVASASRDIRYYAVPFEIPAPLRLFMPDGVIKSIGFSYFVIFAVAIVGGGLVWAMVLLHFYYHNMISPYLPNIINPQANIGQLEASSLAEALGISVLWGCSGTSLIGLLNRTSVA